MIKRNSSALFVDQLPGIKPVFKNKVDLDVVVKQSFVTLGQMTKGNAAGLYVQEPSGEPGTKQWMYVRGLPQPLLNISNVYDVQPAVYINGVPMITDNAFNYNIQRYDINPIGPATDLYSVLNGGNIESIEVLKDAATLAKLGPNAANGVIWVTTKQAHSGYRQIEFNSYYGIAAKPNVTPINAVWEDNFRAAFYNKYGTLEDKLNYPAFLRDSSDINYYGPSDWVNSYYKNKPYHSIDFSLSGGTNRANFRFAANNTRGVGVGDGTYLDRYGASFFINMAPLTWFTVSAMMNANRLQRQRNKNIRDRLAETGYMPDLTNPIAPNNAVYGGIYLPYYKAAIDDNKNNSVQGYFTGTINLKNFQMQSRIAYDYNEGIRDVFWPTTLMEGNNYVSNYFNYNQRLLFSNVASYILPLAGADKLEIEVGQSFQKDRHKYDYVYGYNTLNDFIKIIKVDVDPNKAKDVNYTGMQPYSFRYTDRMGFTLASLYGKVAYTGLNDALYLSAVLRNDGFSGMAADHRWLATPLLSASYNLKKIVLKDVNIFSSFNVNSSWGKIGKLINTDRYAAGPQYVVDLGWSSETNIGTYRGLPALSRPYTSGWVGYGIPWAYSEKFNIGLNAGILEDRIMISVDWYTTDDKNQIIGMPASSETGYSSIYTNGMTVNNKGIDITLGAQILKNINGLNWTFNANLNKNTNKLKALPNGRSAVIIGDNKLEVGRPIDAFWVYENGGIYNSNAEVPTNVNGDKLNLNGVPFAAGDAIWKDQNGDGIISGDDKVLKGHYLPTMSGGFGSEFNYKGFNFNFQFYYALGRKILNQAASDRLNFINVEAANDINSVKEITYWQKPFEIGEYPLYNPWSSTIPFRVDQDLFLQNASFLKLRSVTIGYDFAKYKWFSTKGFKSAQLYLSAANLFTVTPFKDGDPELSLYNGIYNGVGMAIPRSYTVGVKLDF